MRNKKIKVEKEREREKEIQEERSGVKKFIIYGLVSRRNVSAKMD